MAFLVVGADKRPDQPTSVYVMACGGHVKIGLAVNVAVRRKHLQAACPIEVTVAAELLFADFATARAVERELHAEFADCRGFGEWFNVSGEAATEALRRHARRAYERPAPPEPEPPAPPAEIKPCRYHTKADREIMKALAF